MKIVYLGSGRFGIDCLNALARSQHNLQLVVTQPPQPAGRGRKPRPMPVAEWATRHSIPLIETDNVNSVQTIDKIAGCGPDLFVAIAFGRKIGNRLINIPSKDTINVHASLLPRYRGAAPVNWAIVNGERQSGVTIFSIVEEIDAGPILAQAKTEIQPNETAGRLHDRLAELAAPLLLETIDKIADGSATHTEQDHSRATLAPRLKKNDALLDFDEPADLLERKIRGFWPWPGASAVYLSANTGKSIRVAIAMAQAVDITNPQDLPSGTVDENLNIICGRGALKIIEIKPAAGRLMQFKDFVNGRQARPGDRFAKTQSKDSGFHTR